MEHITESVIEGEFLSYQANNIVIHNAEPSYIDTEYYGIYPYNYGVEQTEIGEVDIHEVIVNYISTILKMYSDPHMSASIIRKLFQHLGDIHLLPSDVGEEWIGSFISELNFHSRDIEAYWETVVAEWVYTSENTILIGIEPVWGEYPVDTIESINQYIEDNKAKQGNLCHFPIFSSQDMMEAITHCFTTAMCIENEITYIYKKMA